MHTIQRKVVIHTTLRIVGYLLLWKYSRFIFGTENRKIIGRLTSRNNFGFGSAELESAKMADSRFDMLNEEKVAE